MWAVAGKMTVPGALQSSRYPARSVARVHFASARVARPRAAAAGSPQPLAARQVGWIAPQTKPEATVAGRSHSSQRDAQYDLPDRIAVSHRSRSDIVAAAHDPIQILGH